MMNNDNSKEDPVTAKLKSFKFENNGVEGSSSLGSSGTTPTGSWSSRPVRPRPSLNVGSASYGPSTTSVTRSRPAPGPLTFSNSISPGGDNLRFTSSVLEQDNKLKEIMSQTGLLQVNGKKIPAKIDDFELLGDLGNGTCGHVVKMKHKGSGQIIAVKQMRRTSNSDENKRIIMDLDVVLKSHDCAEIVLCLGCFITDSDVWICMELMATCFDKLLKFLKKPIPEPICGKVAVATVKALNYLKERHGVIHRDVKPSNILLEEKSGRVKLCDFGISGRLVDSKAKTRSAGCAAYMAPERIDPPNPSKPDYDIRADVWSLGITLVELATGHFPYRDCKTDFEVLTKVLQDDPPLLPQNSGFSQDFQSFVRDCLMKNYKDRPKYTKLLKHSFIQKYEALNVDVGSWYKTSTEAIEKQLHPPLTSSVPMSSPNSSSSSLNNNLDMPFKPMPSPRVVRSSRRPPLSTTTTSITPPTTSSFSSNYPSAISKAPTTPPSPPPPPVSSTSPYRSRHALSFGSPILNRGSGSSSSYYDHHHPSASSTSSSSYRTSHHHHPHHQPVSAPPHINGGSVAAASSSSTSSYYSRPSSSSTYSHHHHYEDPFVPRYRESPSVSRKFDFTFPTPLYNNPAADSQYQQQQYPQTSPSKRKQYPPIPPPSTSATSTTSNSSRSRDYVLHYPTAMQQLSSDDFDSSRYYQPASSILSGGRLGVGGGGSSRGQPQQSQQHQRSPSHERPSRSAAPTPATATPSAASTSAGAQAASSSSSSTFSFPTSWRNFLSPLSVRRLRTSSTDRSSNFDATRRFQPSYRSWNNEKDNYTYSTKR